MALHAARDDHHVRHVSWLRRGPLIRATALVVTSAGLGYLGASVTTGTVSTALFAASTGLLFTAFLGGVVKLLIDDHQRAREQRAEQARFLAAMLSDLKAVYDRVERARIVIVAHESARTYGSEMRDLIDAVVKLRNVKRALDTTSGFKKISDRDALLDNVSSMEAYLSRLLNEFQNSYKAISNEQRIFESTFDRLLNERDLSDPPPQAPPNEPWQLLEKLKELKEFRSVEHAEYSKHFVAALDETSTILRSEVVRIRPS